MWACFEKRRTVTNYNKKLYYVAKRVMGGDVGVGDSTGNRSRRRPKQMWLDSIRNDLLERELSGEEAQDRVKCRRCLKRNIDSHIKLEFKDTEEEEERLSIYFFNVTAMNYLRCG